VKHVELKTISIKGHPEINEKWVQEIIAKDPSRLRLGDVRVIDKERMQPKAGRLDLLLQDQDLESSKRYEVEIQLGASDESHIIRTIEYWDIERKRYPQYDHVGVLIAEDITSRFLNVISLFNSAIPLMALQMSAVEIDGGIGLIFTKVLDVMPLGLVDDGETPAEQVDRGYWENKRGTPATVSLVDLLLELLKEYDDGYLPNYNKHYIGLSKSGISDNFLIFQPRKKALNFNVRLPRSDDITSELESSGLDIIEYSSKSGRYRLRLESQDIEDHKELLSRLIREAYEAH